MLEIGTFQNLKAYKQVDHGMYLADDEGNEVLLPSKYVPSDLRKGDQIDVFLYADSQERLVATTQKPKINLYEFAVLKCVDIAPFGAFMDWGLDRDLLVPNAEQEEPMKKGLEYLVYLFLDEEDRITGTTHITRCISNEDFDLEVGAEVNLLVYDFTHIGIRVIIDQQYDGLLYKEQVQAPLKKGDQIKGYIQRIREDHKIDVSLHRFGYNKVIDNKERILNLLRSTDGFIRLHDKSSPEDINYYLQISKKVFKKAIGALYREKKITIEEDGIRLIKKDQSGQANKKKDKN